MGCTHNDRECFDCATSRHAAEHPGVVDGCLSCKLGTLQVSPRVSGGGRLKPSGAPAGPRNSWEKGIALDERGVPFLDNGSPIPVKKFAAGRQRYMARRHELRNSPAPFAAGTP